MSCKSKERTTCIVYRNESSKELIGLDAKGMEIFKRNIKYVEDRCPHENECEIKPLEPRGLRLMQ